MFPFMIEREDRQWLAALAVIALLQAVALFFVSFSIADGHFMFPLDDSYIHLQYAKMLAQGNALVYTPGMEPSGGMTSPLYVLLHAPLFLLKLNGAKAAFASFCFGTMLWMLLPVWTFQLVKQLTNRLLAAVAATLVLANGHLLWCFLSGMETGLFTILLLGAALGAQTWWQGEREHGRIMLIACLALLPLTRPEGMIGIVAMAGILLVRRGEQPRISLIMVLLAALPFVLWLVTLKVGTGDWRPAGLKVKGLSQMPYAKPHDMFAFATDSLTSIATKFYFNIIPDDGYAAFKGRRTMPYVPAGLALAALFGAGLSLVQEGRAHRAAGGSFLAVAWLLGLLAVATSLFPFVHQQRYLAPYTVCAVVLAMVALRRIAQLFQQLEETVVRAAWIALLALSLPSLGYWMTEHGRNARDIYHVLRVATFSVEHEREPAAMTDAGVLAYYTNMPMYDLVGLTSREFTASTLHGEGSTLEVLGRLPQQPRPRTLFTYRPWFGPHFPLGEPESTTAIPHTSITWGNVLQRFPILWAEIERGLQPPVALGEQVFLSVNVADLESEAAAGYDFRLGPYDVDLSRMPAPVSVVTAFEVHSRLGDVETSPVLSLSGSAVAGGRVVRGESFAYAPEELPSVPLVLRMRVGRPMNADPPGPPATRLVVGVTSNTTGYTARREVMLSSEGELPIEEFDVDLTGAIDEAGGTTWRISVEAENAAWASYHYWIIGRLREAPTDRR